MREELVLAPSGGHSEVSFPFWLGCDLFRVLQFDSAAWCSQQADSWFRDHPQDTERGQEVWRPWRCTCFARYRLYCVVCVCACVCVAWRAPSLSDTHRVTHCPRYQQSVQYTHKLCSHPPLLLIQCSNSTLFCNTVTQSHQLFIKDFCTCSVVGLKGGEIWEEVKKQYYFPKKIIHFSAIGCINTNLSVNLRLKSVWVDGWPFNTGSRFICHVGNICLIGS